MEQNTQDTMFWTQTASDYYYVCNNDYDCVLGGGASADTTRSSDANNLEDWTEPLADDDPLSPFCTPNSDSQFACKKLKCIVQRPLNTGNDNDFQFSPSASTPDKMLIRPGRAFLGINDANCSSCSYM